MDKAAAAVEWARASAVGELVAQHPVVAVAALALVMAVIVSRVLLKRRVARETGGIPGSPGLPLVGETLAFLSNADQFFTDRFDKHGPVFWSQLPWGPTLAVTGESLVRKALNSLRTSDVMPSAAVVFGEKSVLVASGPLHKKLRNVALGALAPACISKSMPTVFEVQQRGLKKLILPQGEFVDAYPRLQRMALMASIAQIVGADGLPGMTEEDMYYHLEQYSLAVMALPINLPMTQFGKGLRSQRIIYDAVQREMDRRRSEAGWESKHDDALNTLMTTKDKETGELLTDEEIQQNAALLLFASQDTTATLLSITVQTLEDPTKQGVREKIHAETQAALKSSGKSNLGEFSYEELLEAMPFALGFARECTRQMPPIGFTVRHMHRDIEITTDEGKSYTLPKGYTLLIGLKNTMENWPNFKNRESFEPERFLPPRDEHTTPSRYGFMSFSAGFRLCPGMQFALTEGMFLASLLSDPAYKLELREPIDWLYTFGPRPSRGIQLGVRKL